MPTPQPDDTTPNLVQTGFQHPAGSCGERVDSPHVVCRARYAPYHAAEAFATKYARIILCRCGTAWRAEVAA